jgi:hypothetical protein
MKRALFGTVVFSLFALTVAAQPRQTDKEFDGLRARVKTVVVEEAQIKEMPGESMEQGRVLSRSVTYDADGNWTQRKEYDTRGNLSQTLVFTYIGRDRVALANDEWDPNALVVIKPIRNSRRIDPRYSYKFKYIYGADGKRFEELWYFSDGSLYLKYVHKLNGKRKVRFLYTASGKLNEKVESVLDEKGNEIEVLLRDTVKVGYKYLEFDSQGNWTKRVVTRGLRGFSASDFAKIKPWSIQYRTITYH